MDDSRYGKYIIRDSYHVFETMQTEAFNLSPAQLGTNLVVTTQGIYKPFIMGQFKEPHKHDFYQLLIFVGGDPTHVRDFGAEIEMYLGVGKDQEKHFITSPTAITVPPGLFHLPCNFKRVEKPIVFIEVMLTNNYEKISPTNVRYHSTPGDISPK